MYIPCHFLFSFIRSLSQFHNFVDPIKADGGGDTPEDIMGALKVTFSRLRWRSSATKVHYCNYMLVCHIASSRY